MTGLEALDALINTYTFPISGDALTKIKIDEIVGKIREDLEIAAIFREEAQIMRTADIDIIDKSEWVRVMVFDPRKNKKIIEWLKEDKG